MPHCSALLWRPRSKAPLILVSAVLAASAMAFPAIAQAPPAKEEDAQKRQKQQHKPPQGQPPARQGQGTQTPPPQGPRAHTPPPGAQPNRGAAPTRPPQPPPTRQANPDPVPPRPTPPPARQNWTPPTRQAGPQTQPPANLKSQQPPPPGAPSRVQQPVAPAIAPPQAVPGARNPANAVVPPPSRPGGRPPAAVAAPGSAPAIGAPGPSNVVRPVAGPQRIDQVRSGRVRTVSKSGQTIIQEPGNRTIVKQDNRVFITRNETTSIKLFAPGATTTRRANGISETVFTRPGGVRVVSEVDGSGRLLRRYRRDGSGREIVLVDNRRFYRNVGIGVGVGILAAVAIVALPRPVFALPRERYIVDYVRASDEDCYDTLIAPPVERLERTYSLEEVRYSESLRARMRRIDLDNINFDTGSFAVTPDQYGKLERIARAIGRAIEHNPAEVFLIEGHSDAVGSQEDNLSLSDRRAESVARVLVEYYNIPIENLVTQGYGEQFPKIDTLEAERINRRVAVRRISPLLGQRDRE